MTTETIKQEVIELISELFKDKGFDIDIIEYVDLIDDLGMDSITFITLIVDIEAAFDITVPDDMLIMKYYKNVDDVIRVVAKQLAEKEGECDDET